MNFLKEREKENIILYLSEEKMAVLSMRALDGTVDAAAVFFFTDQDLNFYFTTKVGTRKYRNIEANSQVTLTIPNAEVLKTVEVKGTASVVTDSKEIADHIISLNKKSKQEGAPWAPPIALLSAGQYVIIKVIPTWLRYGVFLNEEPKGQYFKQII